MTTLQIVKATFIVTIINFGFLTIQSAHHLQERQDLINYMRQAK